MFNLKSFNKFIMEASATLDANGSQVDCYATDWATGNLSYMSIVNRDSLGWTLDKIGIFHGLDKDEMIRYNNEVQALMLESAIKRDNYIYFICKNETDKEMFNTVRWKELVNQDATGAILKPGSTISVDDFKNIIENHFPFTYFTNSEGSAYSTDTITDRERQNEF
jgi:hypothetical protein